jgi:hypothetical protein
MSDSPEIESFLFLDFIYGISLIGKAFGKILVSGIILFLLLCLVLIIGTKSALTFLTIIYSIFFGDLELSFLTSVVGHVGISLLPSSVGKLGN